MIYSCVNELLGKILNPVLQMRKTPLENLYYLSLVTLLPESEFCIMVPLEGDCHAADDDDDDDPSCICYHLLCASCGGR